MSWNDFRASIKHRTNDEQFAIFRIFMREGARERVREKRERIQRKKKVINNKKDDSILDSKKKQLSVLQQEFLMSLEIYLLLSKVILI